MRVSFGSQVTYGDQQTPTDATRSGDHSTPFETHIYIETRRQTESVGVHLAQMRVYTTGEMTIGCLLKAWRIITDRSETQLSSLTETECSCGLSRSEPLSQ